MGIAHALEGFGGQGRAGTATAIKHNGGLGIGDGLFNITLQDAFPDVGGPGNVGRYPFPVFPDVDQAKGIGLIEPRFHFVDVFFLDVFLDTCHQIRKLAHDTTSNGWTRFRRSGFPTL